MMKKRLSVFVSFVLVLVLAASFGLPVSAASTSSSWSEVASGVNGTVTKSAANVNMKQLLDSEVYYTSVDNKVPASYTSNSFYYFTGQHWYYYWRVHTFPASAGYQYRIRTLKLSSGTPSGAVDDGVWLIGTDAQVLQGSAQYLSNRATGTNVIYDGEGVSLSLFFRLLVFDGKSDPDPSVSISYSFAGVDNRLFGTPVALNMALNDIFSAVTSQTSDLATSIRNQTNTLTNGFSNSGMEQTNKNLQDSLATYEQSESQVTDQSVAYIDAVTFFDPTKHLQLMTSVTYVSTFLQDLFVALGDWSVLIMISLSLSFALMLVGWFKYRK